MSPSPQVLQVSTQPEENIPGPPRAVQGCAVSHRQIHVKWEPPLIANGIIGKYRVYYVEVISQFVLNNSLVLLHQLSGWCKEIK